MSKDTSDDLKSFTLPSNPSDRKKIKDAFHELAGHQQFIADKRAAIKDTVAMLHDTYQIPKKLIPKIAKIVFDHNFTEVSAENSVLELIYEGIIDTSSPSDDNEGDED